MDKNHVAGELAVPFPSRPPSINHVEQSRNLSSASCRVAVNVLSIGVLDSGLPEKKYIDRLYLPFPSRAEARSNVTDAFGYHETMCLWTMPL